jgi:hypothetical protein
LATKGNRYANSNTKNPLKKRLKNASTIGQDGTEHLNTISVELEFLWDFVLLSLKTCSVYHEKLFIQVVNDISTQVFNNFFSASDTMEAVKGRFCFHKYECKQGCVIQVILLRSML